MWRFQSGNGIMVSSGWLKTRIISGLLRMMKELNSFYLSVWSVQVLITSYSKEFWCFLLFFCTLGVLCSVYLLKGRKSTRNEFALWAALYRCILFSFTNRAKFKRIKKTTFLPWDFLALRALLFECFMQVVTHFVFSYNTGKLCSGRRLYWCLYALAAVLIICQVNNSAMLMILYDTKILLQT